jgi:hypothetical protein
MCITVTALRCVVPACPYCNVERCICCIVLAKPLFHNDDKEYSPLTCLLVFLPVRSCCLTT